MDACPSSEHPVSHDEPQAYATNIYNNRQPQQKNQRKQEQQEASARPPSKISTSSEPTLNELWRQIARQAIEEQSRVLEGPPIQTIQITDDVSVTRIGDEE